MKNYNQPVPVVGNKYHFFDDGKLSRHYVAECLEVITPQQAKKVLFDVEDYLPVSKGATPATSLWVIWKKACEKHRNKPNSGYEVLGGDKRGYWLFAPETDYFVRCRIPGYDGNDIWFVRKVHDGWFSLDIQSFWQGGELDVSGEMYQRGLPYYNYEEEIA